MLVVWNRIRMYILTVFTVASVIFAAGATAGVIVAATATLVVALFKVSN